MKTEQRTTGFCIFSSLPRSRKDQERETQKQRETPSQRVRGCALRGAGGPSRAVRCWLLFQDAVGKNT